MKKSLMFPPLRGETLSVLENLLKEERKGKQNQIVGVCAFSSKTSDNDDSITEQAHES